MAGADGGWRFAGREDSLVKIRGRWVNLIELAEHLGANAPGVVEGAAVCVPDADGVPSKTPRSCRRSGQRSSGLGVTA